MSIKIERCVCSDVTFVEMKEVMEKKKLKSLAELQKEMDVSNNCMLCRPYILNMIKTGKTVFTEILNESDDKI